MLEVFQFVSVGDGEINQLTEVLIQYYFIGNACIVQELKLKSVESVLCLFLDN
jgi:hypothetical protein